MSLDDESLQRLLQQVDVPADLQARLREIPELATKSLRERPPRDGRRWFGWAVAATVLTVAAIAGAFWMRQFSGRPEERIVRSESLPADPNAASNQKTAPPIGAEGGREIRDSLRWVTDLVRSLEVDALRKARDGMMPRRSTVNADPRNVESLIVGLADRSALDWGASSASVGRDMQRILKKYPNSPGAELASQVLSQPTF